MKNFNYGSMQIVLEQLEVKFLFSWSVVQASNPNDGLGMMVQVADTIFATLDQYKLSIIIDASL